MRATAGGYRPYFQLGHNVPYTLVTKRAAHNWLAPRFPMEAHDDLLLLGSEYR